MKNKSPIKAGVYQLVLILIFTAVFSQLKAQDASFSQFYNNPIYYNPGYIGLNAGMRARFNYRDQWVGLPVDYKTYNFSMDMAERNIPGSGGLGVLVLSDRAGTAPIKTNSDASAPTTYFPTKASFS